MAFTDFTPKTEIQFAQDARDILIKDLSTWNGEEASCIKATVKVYFFDEDYLMYLLGTHEMIGDTRDDFNSYLSDDGLRINISDISGDYSRFMDGYYMIKTVYDDDTYEEEAMPYYDNHQANLAKYRCMVRKLPIKFIEWPKINSQAHKDIQIIRMLIDAAEDAVDFGKKERFHRFISVMDKIFDKYEITECF